MLTASVRRMDYAVPRRLTTVLRLAGLPLDSLPLVLSAIWSGMFAMGHFRPHIMHEDDSAMNANDCPQEISQDESRLGFELRLIDGIGALRGSQITPIPVPLVAKVLSSSDILIKIYDHKGGV